MDAPVSPDRAARIRDLFDEVVDLAPADQVKVLDEACQDDPALRDEIETLLQADTKSAENLSRLDFIPPESTDAYVGQCVSHYDIVSVLGRGGMGVVYKAIDTRLNRTVALKFLPPHLSGDPAAKRRFIREARAASSLDHPSICTIFDIDEVDGKLFIVMEFIAGLSLAAKIDQGRIQLGDAVGLAVQVLQGLAAAHASGIIHRDIKPANIMITDASAVKILDFGLAKLSTETTLTKSGKAYGTASYMSPEQARGDKVDHRTDLFSIGVVLYEMIAGQRAFKGDMPEAIIFSILNEDPEPLASIHPDVPEELDRIVKKSLAKNADERYQDAEAVLLDLKRLNRILVGPGQVVSAQESRKRRRTASGGRAVSHQIKKALPFLSNRVVAGAAVGALMALAVLIGIYVGRRTAAHPSPKPVYTSLEIPEIRFLDTAISPDGRYMAYTHSRTGGKGHTLSIYDFQTGLTLEVERNRRVRIPRFSHDSSLFGFIEGKDLFIGPVDLSSQPVLAFGIGIQYVIWAWAPDGTIVLTRGDLKRIERITQHGDVLPDVAEVDPSAGELRLWPANFFPDGRLLLQAENDARSMDLYALDLETGERSELPTIRNTWSVYSHSGHLLYTPLKDWRVYARAFNPVTLQFRGAAAEIVVPDNFYYLISDTGRFVYYDDAREPGYIPKLLSYVDPDGTQNPLPFPKDDYSTIRIDPLGARIAVIKNRRLFVADLSGSTQMQQITDSTAHSAQVWSSDSEEILFGAQYKGIYSVRSNGVGGSPNRLSTDFLLSRIQPGTDTARDLGFGDWSSNGEFVAILNQAFDHWAESITVISLDDSTTVLRILHADGVSSPRFSPDSRWMAYTKQTAPGSQIWIASIDGSIDRQISTEGGASPTWSSDLSALYFIRDLSLYELPLRVSETIESVGDPREIFRAEYPFVYDVMPDGSGFIVAEATEAPSRTLTVVDNYFEELKERAPVSE